MKGNPICSFQAKQIGRLLGSMAVALLLAIATAAAAQESRPNVVLIMVDDLRPTLGAYGDAIASTPNIDSLAAGGFLFRNNFANVPVCGASRASLMSGRKPTTRRFLTYNSRLDEDLADAISLPAHFQSHAYRTLANGKLFDVSADSAAAWSEGLWNPERQWRGPVQRETRHEDLQKAYLDSPAGELGPAFERLDVADQAYPDGQVAERTVADIARLAEADEPFFLAVGFRKPHLPFTAPAKYWDLYEREQFTLPSTYDEAPLGAPLQALHNSGELRNQYAGIPAAGLLPPAQARELIHGYYAAVSFADAQVGKVLAALEENGIEDNTIVVLIGDHGWNLGEHTLWVKHSLFDVSLRTPLIIRVPGKTPRQVEQVVDLLDLYPTLVDLSRTEAATTLDGTSLLPLMNDPEAKHKEYSISRWFAGESFRSSRFRYTEWLDEQHRVQARMLYDLRSDAEESVNVAERDEYAAKVAEFERVLRANGGRTEWAPLLRRVLNTN